MAFVVNEMRDLLKIRATTSNKHDIQPEASEKNQNIIVVEKWRKYYMQFSSSKISCKSHGNV